MELKLWMRRLRTYPPKTAFLRDSPLGESPSSRFACLDFSPLKSEDPLRGNHHTAKRISPYQYPFHEPLAFYVDFAKQGTANGA